jgi:hypothetical protein
MAAETYPKYIKQLESILRIHNLWSILSGDLQAPCAPYPLEEFRCSSDSLEASKRIHTRAMLFYKQERYMWRDKLKEVLRWMWCTMDVDSSGLMRRDQGDPRVLLQALQKKFQQSKSL